MLGSCDACMHACVCMYVGWRKTRSAFVRSLFSLIVMVELVFIYIFRAFHLIKGILNTRREWNICCTTHYKKKNKLQPFYHTERHAHCVRNSFLVGLVLLFAAIWLARCCAKTFAQKQPHKMRIFVRNFVDVEKYWVGTLVVGLFSVHFCFVSWQR